MELLLENYFRAVFEPMKSITAKIRSLSGLTGDGCNLVNQSNAAAGPSCDSRVGPHRPPAGNWLGIYKQEAG